MPRPDAAQVVDLGRGARATRRPRRRRRPRAASRPPIVSPRRTCTCSSTRAALSAARRTRRSHRATRRLRLRPRRRRADEQRAGHEASATTMPGRTSRRVDVGTSAPARLIVTIPSVLRSGPRRGARHATRRRSSDLSLRAESCQTRTLLVNPSAGSQFAAVAGPAVNRAGHAHRSPRRGRRAHRGRGQRRARHHGPGHRGRASGSGGGATWRRCPRCSRPYTPGAPGGRPARST